MSKELPLLHVGHTKTGSTYLQRNLFDETPFFPLISYRDIASHLIEPSTRDYKITSVKGLLSGNDDPSLCGVVSHECLLGNPVSGGYDEEVLAERLKALFPEARVLLVFREQTSHLASFYPEYLKHGGMESFKGFLNPVNNERIPYFSPSFLKYDLQVKRYQELYGPENVLALPYELFRNDSKDFVSRLGSFCGLKLELAKEQNRVNTSPGVCRLASLRLLNRFRRTNLGPAPIFEIPGMSKVVKSLSKMDGWEPKKFSLKSASKRRNYAAKLFGDFYASSNKELVRLTTLDLESYGYTVSK